jgi:predicted phage terminase large subunit-like protein
MGDVCIGDSIITPDGEVSKVIGIPFDGTNPTYRITFSDGTYVDAGINHKWKVNCSDWNRSANKWRVKSTYEMSNDFIKSNGRLKYKVPNVSSDINFGTAQHIISPYILGVLLGDGTITKSNPIKITNIAKEIYTRINDELFIGYHTTKQSGKLKNNYNISRPGYGYNNSKNIYATELERMKLLGCKAKDKFIPEEYLYDSATNRLSILQGLMDTDGGIRIHARGNEIKYSTISEKLKDNIVFLVQSLGGIATWKKENNYCYRIFISLNLDVFSLKRKKDVQLKNQNVSRMIKNIEYIGEIPVKCITIDHPDHLFITNNFIVTKNSGGGGKSDALLMAALQYVDIPGYNAILIRDTYANLVKPEGLLYRADEWLAGTDAHWDGDSRSYVFPSGATLSFGYLDGPKDHYNYQGPAYTFVGIDEIVNIRQHQAEYLFSRLRKKDKDAYLIDLKKLPQYKDLPIDVLLALQKAYARIPLRFRGTANPPARQQLATGKWVKDKYVDKKSRDKSTIFIPAGIKDNPSLNEAEYRKSLDRLDPITRKQIMDGDWNINVSGRIMSRAWFRVVDIFPDDQIVKKVRFWDLAATEEDAEKGNDPCYTAGVKMGLTKDNQYIIINITRFRKKPLGVEQMIRQVADIDTTKTPICVEHEGGSSGKISVDHFRRNVLREFTFTGELPKGSKIERASPFASQAEAGNVLLLNGAWVEDFLDEADVFPDGKFKDQIDAASGAFTILATKLGGVRVRTL